MSVDKMSYTRPVRYLYILLTDNCNSLSGSVIPLDHTRLEPDN